MLLPQRDRREARDSDGRPLPFGSRQEREGLNHPPRTNRWTFGQAAVRYVALVYSPCASRTRDPRSSLRSFLELLVRGESGATHRINAVEFVVMAE